MTFEICAWKSDLAAEIPLDQSPEEAAALFCHSEFDVALTPFENESLETALFTPDFQFSLLAAVLDCQSFVPRMPAE